MPEPLKNQFSIDFVEQVGKAFHQVYAEFKPKQFVAKTIGKDWETLELKQRMFRISSTLAKYLPEDYPHALSILVNASSSFSGMTHMCFPDFVEKIGIKQNEIKSFELSMAALEAITEGSSAEFAVRPFILAFEEKAMLWLKKWSKSENEHVRRLASEGCRPRLPWAPALPQFKNYPSPVLEIILPMMSDESLYVRRSVANNLNDISKDNPEIVVEVAQSNLGKNKEVDWVLKHACRGLLKKGHPTVMQLFGFAKPTHIKLRNFKVDEKVTAGDNLNFQFDIQSKTDSLGKVRLEFIIHFQKANNKTSSKIFKISESELTSKNKAVKKYFSFRPISTRRYYPGQHRISIIINGHFFAEKSFELKSCV